MCGLSLVVVLRLLIEVAALLTEDRLQSVQASVAAALGLSSCGSTTVGCAGLGSCGARA